MKLHGMVKAALLVAMAITLASCERYSEAKDAVRQQLKDPASARFQNVIRDGRYVCGEYNAKNGYGAYGGFDVFYYDTVGKFAVLGQARCIETVTLALKRQNDRLRNEVEAKKAAARY